jgi:hypothetical protein
MFYIFYGLKSLFHDIVKLKKNITEKYAWSFCMGLLPSMPPPREQHRERVTAPTSHSSATVWKQEGRGPR